MPRRSARGRVGGIPGPNGIGRSRPRDEPYHGFDDVVDIGEVPAHPTVVEQFDWPTLHDRVGEQPHRHVWPAPRAVDGEKPQTSYRHGKQVRIGMCHQLVGFLCGTVEAQRVVDVVGGAEGHAGIGAIHRRRRGINEVPAPRVAAAFEHVEETAEIGSRISMRID